MRRVKRTRQRRLWASTRSDFPRLLFTLGLPPAPTATSLSTVIFGNCAGLSSMTFLGFVASPGSIFSSWPFHPNFCHVSLAHRHFSAVATTCLCHSLTICPTCSGVARCIQSQHRCLLTVLVDSVDFLLLPSLRLVRCRSFLPDYLQAKRQLPDRARAKQIFQIQPARLKPTPIRFHSAPCNCRRQSR